MQLNIKGGNMVAINEGYRRLKVAGWKSIGAKHPNDNMPVFKRGEALIRRDVEAQHDWIMWFNSGPLFNGYGFDGDIQEITKEVDRMLNQETPT